MKKQQLNITDFQDWLRVERVMYASESNAGKLKRMFVYVGSSNIEIEVNGEVVWKGMQPYPAIEKYNEL